MSARRLGVLIRGLSVDSALVRALNGGKKPWGNAEHLLADLWGLIVKVNSPEGARTPDHPTRAEMEAKARTEAKLALKANFQRRKKTYGLG